ncbi:hypothetical protein [Corynebacterium glutamicum]|uniref:hypothetical protein n=1 Tax=Corynebacterium glutamicum TaxID=1718 RepID=UPI00094372FA|nr:hypothetical protein [Corynebacterium glutamicum]OKX85159.1 hypothetical protein AUO95_01085 [Corynebacterium glutamicum]
MTIAQAVYPRSKRLVRFTSEKRGTSRRVCVGDLVDSIHQLPWTPLMAISIMPIVSHRRFVHIGVARKWADDLETKQHRKPSADLSDLLDWVEAHDVP